jgi:DNA-binding LacI/PurR family transcriptional regulator
MADQTTAPELAETGPRPARIRNIAELARIAGVSAGTVSRALAGKDLVNAETRERIQAIAREHGFRPNQMARRLRTQRTGVIGVVIPLGHEKRQQISDPFFMTLIGYLADELTESGHDIMLTRVIPGDPEWLERIVDSGMLDGALVIGQSDQFETIEKVAEHYLPMVVWGSYRQGQRHCVVGSDNTAGGRLAARRLVERGAKRIAFFGDTRGPEIAARLEGVREVVAEAGIELLPYPTHLSIQEMGDQIEAQLDELGGAVDGIVAASDVIAMATVRLLHARGVRIPEDVAVVGYDDLPLAMQTVPQLTTVRQEIAAGARLMVEKLMQRIAGEATSSTVMPPQLIVRASA